MKLEKEGYDKTIIVKFEDFALIREKGYYIGMIHWMEKDGILLIYLLFLSNLILEVPELWTFILCTVVKKMVSSLQKNNWIERVLFRRINSHLLTFRD